LWKRLLQWVTASRARRVPTGAAVAALVLVLGVLLVTRKKIDPTALWELARESRQHAEGLVGSHEFESAEHACRQALGGIDELLARWPRQRTYRLERALALGLLGQALQGQDRSDEADETYKQETALWANLVAEEPSSIPDRCLMAECLDRAGTLLREDGRWEEAEGAFNRGYSVCAQVPPELAGETTLERHQVTLLERLGSLLEEMGRRPETLDRYGQAVRIQRGIVRSPSAQLEDRIRLISLLIELADALAEARKRAAAEAALVEARELSERLIKADPALARAQQLAASALHRLGKVVRTDPKRLREARDALLRAYALRESLLRHSSAVPTARAELAATCGSLASLNRDLKSFDAAEDFYRKELAHRALLVEDAPTALDLRFAHGRALHELADLLREQARPSEALPFARAAVRELDRVYRQNVRDSGYQRAISFAYWELCEIELDCGDHRAAAQAVADYLKSEPHGYEEPLEAARFLCRCARLCGADTSLAPKDRDALVKSYADQAQAALRTAVRGGFHDLKDLKSAAIYEPLRSRDDFKDLLREVEARVEQLSAE
jgi:tetratricopeptide (TPR) repeat protein